MLFLQTIKLVGYMKMFKNYIIDDPMILNIHLERAYNSLMHNSCSIFAIWIAGACTALAAGIQQTCKYLINPQNIEPLTPQHTTFVSFISAAFFFSLSMIGVEFINFKLLEYLNTTTYNRTRAISLNKMHACSYRTQLENIITRHPQQVHGQQTFIIWLQDRQHNIITTKTFTLAQFARAMKCKELLTILKHLEIGNTFTRRILLNLTRKNNKSSPFAILPNHLILLITNYLENSMFEINPPEIKNIDPSGGYISSYYKFCYQNCKWPNNATIKQILYDIERIRYKTTIKAQLTTFLQQIALPHQQQLLFSKTSAHVNNLLRSASNSDESITRAPKAQCG